MVKKILFISLALFGLLFSTMPPACFADAAAQLEQAETYKNNEQYEQAEAIYKTVVTDYAGSDYALEAQKNLAILYIDWGKGPQAQAACERLITDFSSHPALPGALYQVANQYQILQRHEQALELYQYIVDNCPESDRAVPSQMDVVISNLELGNDAEAQAATDKLIADFAGHPALPEALYGVADKYQDSQRHEQAIELFQYLADTWPESDGALPAQMDVVMSNLELGNDAEAEAALDKLIADFAAHPDLPDVLYHLANEYQGRQRHEQARQLYQYIADNRPKSDMAVQAQMDVVISNIALGDDPNAQAALDSLIADFNDRPGLPEALNEVASQYEERRRYEKAIELYQYIADNLPEEYVILSRGRLIMLDIGLGNDANAQAALDSLIADFNDHPALPQAVFIIGEQYYNKAFRDVKQGLDTEAKENFRKAIAVWERIITKLPPSAPYTARAYYFSGYCYTRSGEYGKAIQYYQKVADDWPKYEYAWHAQLRVARCYEVSARSGRISKADAAPHIRQACEKLLANYPGSKGVKEARDILKRWGLVSNSQ